MPRLMNWLPKSHKANAQDIERLQIRGRGSPLDLLRLKFDHIREPQQADSCHDPKLVSGIRAIMTMSTVNERWHSRISTWGSFSRKEVRQNWSRSKTKNFGHYFKYYNCSYLRSGGARASPIGAYARHLAACSFCFHSHVYFVNTSLLPLVPLQNSFGSSPDETSSSRIVMFWEQCHHQSLKHSTVFQLFNDLQHNRSYRKYSIFKTSISMLSRLIGISIQCLLFL